jgi:hypothetical protein
MSRNISNINLNSNSNLNLNISSKNEIVNNNNIINTSTFNNIIINKGIIKNATLDNIKYLNITNNTNEYIGISLQNLFNKSNKWGIKTQNGLLSILNEDNNYPKIVLNSINNRIGINVDVYLATFHIKSVENIIPSLFIDEDLKNANIKLRSNNINWELGSSSILNGFYIDLYNGNKNIFIITNSGNFGFGLNNSKQPINKLDISGNVVIGKSYAGNIYSPNNGLLIEGNVELIILILKII